MSQSGIKVNVCFSVVKLGNYGITSNEIACHAGPYPLPHAVSCTHNVWKTVIAALTSGVCSYHVSLKHIMLYSWYSFWFPSNAWSSSILFTRNHTSLIMIKGKNCLYCRFFFVWWSPPSSFENCGLPLNWKANTCRESRLQNYTELLAAINIVPYSGLFQLWPRVALPFV